MMSSMDAEAEMEGLFGGEDQGQDEAAATQSLTQEEREAGEANLDVTGAGGDGGDKKKKTVIRKPIPKLDNDRIMGPRGVHTLEELFADFKPRGRGHEFEDLDVVMKKMEHWAHRLFPKLPFNSVLDIIANRLGKKKVVQTHVKKIRLGMLQQPAKDDEVVKDAEDEEEREVERYGEGGGVEDEEEVEDFFANMMGHQGSQVAQAPPPVRSAPIELTDEQKERMRRNKEMAAMRKREKEEREALKKRTREEEEDEGEIEREMLTGGNASEWGPTTSEVEASCLKTVQELSLKTKQSKESLNSPSKASQGSNFENVPSESKEGGDCEKAPEDNARKEDTAEKVKDSIEDDSQKSEVTESENDKSNRSPDEASALSQDESLPVVATEDDLSLAQMMEEMEEDDMEGEEVKEPSKDENVISLDQIMDQMEED